MRRYNFTRPLLLLGVAFGTNIAATNLLVLFGMEPEAAGNAGFMLMLVAAFYTYTRLNRNRRS